MAAIGCDRWLRSLASLSERELASMLCLSATELAYRHRSGIQETLQRMVGLPDPFEVTIDAQSGSQTLRLTMAGRMWEGVTGRRSFGQSNAFSSRSKRSKRSSTASQSA